MHNLGTVFAFEVIRTLKKKSFWIMSLSFPIIIGAILGVVYLSNQATDKAAEDTKNQKFSLQITDESGLIKDAIIDQFGASKTDDKNVAINKITSGQLDAYFFYPKEIDKNKIEVYARDVGLFDNSRYEGVAKIILQQSVSPTVDTEKTTILQDKVQFDSKTYRDGELYDGLKELIAPGIFLVLFYILIAMFGNQMLTSTTEEKENRVTEMILTTIGARTLIIGKILSLIVLAFIQVLTILSPSLIGYLLFREQLALPNFDISNIPINYEKIAIGALIFFFSFMLFTGLLVAIGAAVPTAREANGFFGVAMLFIFGPLYAVTLFVSQPNSTIVQVLSYFPLTSPIPLMLRNAVGNLSISEATIGISILAASSAVIMAIAIRIFRFGVLEYSSRISLKYFLQK